jgi:hypothetical protein
VSATWVLTACAANGHGARWTWVSVPVWMRVRVWAPFSELMRRGVALKRGL